MYDKKQLLSDWEWVRNLTLKFIESIPENKLSFTPGHGFGTLGQQLRHTAAVQECYLIGLETGKINFSQKRKDVDLEQSKEKMMTFMKQLDERLRKALENADLDHVIEWKVWENIPNPTMTQHEIFHQGIWQLYAAQVGFKTVRFF